MNMNNKNLLIGGILILVLLIGNVFLINKINNINDKFENYENTIRALNDTISVSIENGITKYSKLTPEININDLINSEFFNTLTEEQQNFYKELQNIRGLISSTRVLLNRQGELINEILEKENPGDIIDSNICFNLGQTLKFKEEDETNALQYEAKVILDSIIRFKFNYDYNVNIQTSYIRQRDNSILVKYKIDDPKLTVQEMQNFTIPAREFKGPFEEWLYKNRRPLKFVGGTVLFGAGVYTGYKIAN